MNVVEEYPKWLEQGNKPDTEKIENGWEPSEKPPADWFDWFFNTSYEAIKNLDLGKMANHDLFQEGFVKSGGEATENGTTATQLDVTELKAFIKQSGNGNIETVEKSSTSFDTSGVASTTYYLDLNEDATYNWAESHSSDANYLPIAEVTTDSNGDIDSVTDKRQMQPEIDFASVGIDALQIKEKFNFSNEKFNPFPERTFEQSGTLNLAPFPNVSNPVLTASDVSDLSNPNFVADPFLVYENGTYHLFFEILTSDVGEKIGHATSQDGLNWSYDQVVLDLGDTDADHLAFPFVFKFEGEWYMMPDRGPGQVVELYQADTFPTSWSKVETVLSKSYNLVDPTPIYWNDTWFLILYANESGNERVDVYYSDDLVGGNWSLHPSSPIHTGVQFRPGGRPVVHKDYIDFFFQQKNSTYGDETHCYRITELSKTNYSDFKVANSPIIHKENNGGWNDEGMHQIDVLVPYIGGQPIVAVDGQDTNNDWSIGIYTISSNPHVLFRSYLETGDGPITASSGTWTHIPMTKRVHDTRGTFDTVNGYYVIPSSGYYQFNTVMKFSVSDDDLFAANIRVYNKTQGIEIATNRQVIDNPAAVSNGTLSIITRGSFYCNEGDIIQAEFFQDSGVGKDVTDGNEANTYLEGFKLS